MNHNEDQVRFAAVLTPGQKLQSAVRQGRYDTAGVLQVVGRTWHYGFEWSVLSKYYLVN